MGMFDKVKFWKKGDDGLDNFSDLGDFGLDDKSLGSDLDKGSGLGDSGLGDMGPLPAIGETIPSAQQDAGIRREEVQPTQASRDLGDQFGLRQQPVQQPRQVQQQQSQPQQYAQAAAQYPQQQYPQQFQQPIQQQVPQAMQQVQHGPDFGDVAKEIEIMHAKLDAIRSTLDSINQRLASLERIASGTEGRTRNNW